MVWMVSLAKYRLKGRLTGHHGFACSNPSFPEIRIPRFPTKSIPALVVFAEVEIASGNQTWLAGKLTIEMSDFLIFYY